MDISFRRLAHEDLPQLHAWLNEPGVVRWWEGDDVSWDAVVRDYDPDSDDSNEHWIATVDGVDVGWIQCYPAVDDPEESSLWFAHGIDETAAGIDYLLGETTTRGRGVGSNMIRAFVDDVVFGLHPEWTQACAGPFVANEPSWRALAKAGFEHGTELDDPDGPCRLMCRRRSA